MGKKSEKPYYPSKYMAKLGKKGHASRMRKYGKEYYSELGKKSVAARRAKKEAALGIVTPQKPQKKSHFHIIGNFLERGI